MLSNRSGYLPVSGGHIIYYEIHGNPKRKPVVVLHGGPGGGMQKESLSWFDLSKWCVLLFDQRGCGKSLPFGELRHNTTWDLVEDIEALRFVMGVSKWTVTGGSWGTALALAYAETYPKRVTRMVLRGFCLADAESQEWIYEKGGVSQVHPEAWEKFVSVLPVSLRHKGWRSIVRFYHEKLNGKNPMKYANAWWGWESSISRLMNPVNDMNPQQTLAISIIENHYFVNNAWLKEGELLKGLTKLKMPITIIHGRYDMVCPITKAYEAKQTLPSIRLIIVPQAGHSSKEPGIHAALCRIFGSQHTRKSKHII
jgi:proline iminopeptidase